MLYLLNAKDEQCTLQNCVLGGGEKMRKKAVFALTAMLLSTGLMAGCGSKEVTYKDGTYTARSSVFENDDGTDDGNGYGEVTITLKDGVITECEFNTYEEDGTYKDKDYGKEDGRIANKDYYNKAQKANAARSEYADMLVANGQLEGIDSISGATVNYDQFVESVGLALEEAAK